MGHPPVFPPFLQHLLPKGKAKSGKGSHRKTGKGGKKSGKTSAKSSDPKGPLPDIDNESRPYDLDRVIVNFNNVGHTYGGRFMKKTEDGKPCFHWEGVRRCIHHLTEELQLVVIGVIFENFKANDGDLENIRASVGVPEDIRQLCEHVEETPQISKNRGHKSADDEMTIRLAYRRNCLLLDNDNYRDWLQNMKNEKIRLWFQHSQERVHLKYYFDSGLGCFELLEGNTIRSAVEQQRVEKRRAQKDASLEDGGSVELVASGNEASRGSSPRNGVRHRRRTDEAEFLGTMQPQSRSPSKRSVHPEVPVELEQVFVDRFPEVAPRQDRDASSLCSATLDGHIGRMRDLLKLGMDANLPNPQGIHPLYYAVENEDLQAVQLLKRYGASVSNAKGPHHEALTAIVLRRLEEEGAEALPQRLLAELRIVSSGGKRLFEARTRSDEHPMPRSRQAAVEDVILVDMDKRRRVEDRQKVSRERRQQHALPLRPQRNLAVSARVEDDPYGGTVVADECVDLDADDEEQPPQKEKMNEVEDAASCAAKLAAALSAVDTEYDCNVDPGSNGVSIASQATPLDHIPAVVRGVVLRAAEDPYL